MKAIRVIVFVMLFSVIAAASVNATVTDWKPVDSWLDMQTMQWRWAVEQTAGAQAPNELGWGITFSGSSGFDAGVAGPYPTSAYLHVYRFKDYSTRFGVPSNAEVTKIEFRVYRNASWSFNGYGVVDEHMQLMDGNSVKADNFKSIIEPWPTTIGVYAIYSFSPSQWGLTTPFWGSSLPTIGFRLSPKVYSTSLPSGWAASVKCYPSQGTDIAIRITY